MEKRVEEKPKFKHGEAIFPSQSVIEDLFIRSLFHIVIFISGSAFGVLVQE